MLKRYAWWALGALALGGLVMASNSTKPSKRYSYGGPDHNGLSRDPFRLLPVFADKLELLFQRLRARGFDPMLHEGFRSVARAKKLAEAAAKGGPKAIELSMHTLGAAADLKSIKYGYDSPEFYEALGEETKALGLTWGGDFGDNPHVQAVPATNVAQNGIRKAADKNAYAKRYLA